MIYESKINFLSLDEIERTDTPNFTSLINKILNSKSDYEIRAINKLAELLSREDKRSTNEMPGLVFCKKKEGSKVING